MKMGAMVTGAAGKGTAAAPAPAPEMTKSEAAAPPPPPPPPPQLAQDDADGAAAVADRRCCCGCSTRTGSIIIGTLGMVNGFTLLYFALLGINTLRSMDFTTVGNLFLVLFAMVHIITGMGLIHGADQKRHQFVVLWLYTNYGELGLYIGYCFVSIGRIIYIGASVQNVLEALASFTIGTAIIVYCIAIVRNFYGQLIMGIPMAMNEA